MKNEAYRFQDEKSDKFWRLERAGSVLAVNYGKAGTTGKYQRKFPVAMTRPAALRP
jgi:predicted DNA-binding WGR domain protein